MQTFEEKILSPERYTIYLLLKRCTAAVNDDSGRNGAIKCDSYDKCKGRNKNADHKHTVRNANQPVFPAQHFTKIINIINQGAVQVVRIFHHGVHTPFIFFQLTFKKISKEKQVGLFV